MNDQHPAIGPPLPPAQPLAPPTSPGALIAPDKGPPVWPRGLGIACEIAGVCSLAYSGGSFAWKIISWEGTRTLRDEFAQRFWTWVLPLLCDAAAVLLALVVCVLGVLVLMRRRRAVAGVIVWACLKLALVGAVVYVVMGDPDTYNDFEKIAFGAVSAAFPVCILLWFRRPKIKAQIANWR